MRSLCRGAGFNRDVPVEGAVGRERRERPDAGNDHAGFAEFEHAPFIEAAALFRAGADVGDLHVVDKTLERFYVFRTVDGERGVVVVEQTAVVLRITSYNVCYTKLLRWGKWVLCYNPFNS